MSNNGYWIRHIYEPLTAIEDVFDIRMCPFDKNIASHSVKDGNIRFEINAKATWQNDVNIAIRDIDVSALKVFGVQSNNAVNISVANVRNIFGKNQLNVSISNCINMDCVNLSELALLNKKIKKYAVYYEYVYPEDIFEIIIRDIYGINQLGIYSMNVVYNDTFYIEVQPI